MKMVEVRDDPELFLEKKCIEFNNTYPELKATVCSFWTKNMSVYAQSIKVKERKFFGENVRIDYWQNHGNPFFDVEICDCYKLESVKDLAKKVEKVFETSVRITKTKCLH